MVVRMAGWQGRDIRLARVICRMCVTPNKFTITFWASIHQAARKLRDWKIRVV